VLAKQTSGQPLATPVLGEIGRHGRANFRSQAADKEGHGLVDLPNGQAEIGAMLLIIKWHKGLFYATKSPPNKPGELLSPFQKVLKRIKRGEGLVVRLRFDLFTRKKKDFPLPLCDGLKPRRNRGNKSRAEAPSQA
jgi:hypothetical protein